MAFALARWIAIQVGRRQQGLPYYVYDGYDEMFVIRPQDATVAKVHELDGAFTDELGRNLQRDAMDELLAKEMGESEPYSIIGAELERLTALWKAER